MIEHCAMVRFLFRAIGFLYNFFEKHFLHQNTIAQKENFAIANLVEPGVVQLTLISHSTV